MLVAAVFHVATAASNPVRSRAVQSEPAPKPATTQIVVERPEGALARGQYAWPDWGIALVGGAGVVLATAILALRLRARLRGADPSPKSSR
jgi:hypothetical protein